MLDVRCWMLVSSREPTSNIQYPTSALPLCGFQECFQLA
jgi:hypothetical protein